MILIPGHAPEAVPNPDNNVDAVLLLRTENYMTAQFLAGALEEAEIPFVAKRLGLADRLGDSTTGAITHVVYSPPGAAEIYVNPADYARAKEVLDSLEGSELEENEEIDDTEETK